MSNSTIYEQIVEVTQLFVDVPGTVIGGWVGFGVFIVLALATMVLMALGYVPYGAHFYELLCYCVVMLIVYLLAACEQFVFARDDNDHVNLLMIITNGVVWTWAVMGSARRVPNRPPPVVEKYTMVIAVLSQLLFLVSAFVWNGAVYALWGIALVLMLAALGHYVYWIGENWHSTDTYSKQWLAFAGVYTLLYVFLAFLSHLYLAVISLSGAVWAYLVLHLGVYAWLAYSSRVQRGAPARPQNGFCTGGRRGTRAAEDGEISLVMVDPLGGDTLEAEIARVVKGEHGH